MKEMKTIRFKEDGDIYEIVDAEARERIENVVVVSDETPDEHTDIWIKGEPEDIEFVTKDDLGGIIKTINHETPDANGNINIVDTNIGEGVDLYAREELQSLKDNLTDTESRLSESIMDIDERLNVFDGKKKEELVWEYGDFSIIDGAISLTASTKRKRFISGEYVRLGVGSTVSIPNYSDMRIKYSYSVDNGSTWSAFVSSAKDVNITVEGLYFFGLVHVTSSVSVTDEETASFVIVNTLQKGWKDSVDETLSDIEKESVVGKRANNTDILANNIKGIRQGVWNSIANYSNPVPNNSATRICAEIEYKCLGIEIYRKNPKYDYVYALFKEDGTVIKSKSSWETDTTVVYGDIALIRVGIRKVDNSNITPSEFEECGVFVRDTAYSYASFDEIKPPTEYLRLKAMTFNLGKYSYGLNPSGIPSDVFDEKFLNYKRFFASNNVDICGVQENSVYVDTNETVRSDTDLLQYPYPNTVRVPNNVCLLSKYRLKNTGTGQFVASNRWYAYGTMTIDGKDIFLIDVHLQSGSSETAKRQAEMEELKAIVASHKYFIIFGDFNVADRTEFANFSGMNKANGGYTGWYWTYSFDSNDYARYEDPQGEIRFFDNIITSENIKIENAYAVNMYDKLTSDHIPFVADLLIY